VVALLLQAMTKIQVKKLHTLTGHRDCVYTLVDSDTSGVFFSGSGDGLAVMWNLADPEVGSVVAKLPNSIYALHHMPATGQLVVGHNYDGIHMIDWKNKTETGSLKLTTGAIFDIQSEGNNIFVATGDGSVIKVNADELTIAARLEASEKSARTIALNTKRGELAVGFSDCFIRVYDMDTLEQKHEWRAHENSVFTLTYTPDQNYLMSGSRDARLRVWDATTGYKPAAEVVAHMFAINNIAFSRDNKHFVTCSMDKSIKVWDATELKLLKVIDRSRHAGHGTSVNKVLWTNYEDQLVSASDDRTISVWDINFEKDQL